jgi:predicted transcriptional regulator
MWILITDYKYVGVKSNKFSFRILLNDKNEYLCDMRRHNGMRPQDVAILLKIILLGKEEWQYQDLARTLHISGAEVNASLNRSKIAGLIDFNRKRVNKLALFEFLEHGLQYVFPIQPGAVSKGIPTAHSHPSIKNKIISETLFVWPDIGGTEIGQSIEPLFNNQVQAAKEDPLLYEILSLIEILRVGKNREKNIALSHLKKIIEH